MTDERDKVGGPDLDAAAEGGDTYGCSGANRALQGYFGAGVQLWKLSCNADFVCNGCAQEEDV